MEDLKELKLNNLLRKLIVDIVWDAIQSNSIGVSLEIATNLYGYKYRISNANLIAAGIDIKIPVGEVIEKYNLQKEYEKKSKRMKEQ